MFVVCTFHQFTKFRCWILTCHKLMRDIARQPSLTWSPPAGISGMVEECDCFLLMGCKIHVRMRRCLYAYWAKMRVCTYRSNCRTHSDIYIISFISILWYLNLFDVDVPWLCVALSENRRSQHPPSHGRSAGFSAGRTSATCCISSKRAASCLGASSVTGWLDCWAETKTCEISQAGGFWWLWPVSDGYDLVITNKYPVKWPVSVGFKSAHTFLAEVLVSTWRVHNDQVILFLLEKFHTCQCGATLLGWVSASLPPKVACLPPQSSLDPSHCSRHRKVFSPWPVHWQHPKASEDNRRLCNNSRLSLHLKRRTMSYVLAETSDHLVIMVSSSCRSHHLVVWLWVKTHSQTLIPWWTSKYQ